MKKLFLSLALLTLTLPCMAYTVSFDSSNANYEGAPDSTTGGAACSAGDVCADTLTWFNFGGSGVTLDVSAYLWNTEADIVAWHDIVPGGGGLGSAESADLGDSSADNNVGYESIRLMFSSAVHITGLWFTNHGAVSGMTTCLSTTVGCGPSAVTNAAGYAAVDFLTDRLDVESWHGTDFDTEWYLAGIEFTTSVPESSSLILMLLGIAGLVIGRKQTLT
ncbi:PEP-CTERM sorting domain-containing protein [Simiduia aestuariiviva]|uniref:PEP-CTERM protein-sorting domain-containing protein n=1 Tax=Simiduia aestuariiviva TaxID=1510459 RepID=A0A839UQI6_9GAMM|nr:PEP-CTERM sorting domain-containing protein [Simiduia aestuariiviva]MBB3170102.1 hypothetical protein [Simiduia aestuariiviva]